MANIETPVQSYIASDPCVQCFQGKELDALIVLLLAEKAGFTLPDDLADLWTLPPA